MLKILTPSLLQCLLAQGYAYCLSRTMCEDNDDNAIFIKLLPVKEEPDVTNLPDGYDTYFDISEEPVQMAAGVEDVIVLVDLTAAHELVLVE